MGNKIGPALLAGNTMVIKPAETTPLTDLRVVGLFNEAGLPKGALNVVTGQGSVVGEEIVTNPKVRKIGFTGSTEVGRRVMASAAQGIKRVTLELGGSDPMIVCDDADIDEAVKAAATGRFFNCGQASGDQAALSVRLDRRYLHRETRRASQEAARRKRNI
jgi:succinate-semialdehyde dehydrogenase/glutarate-semialdehyde dehydrogenase